MTDETAKIFKAKDTTNNPPPPDTPDPKPDPTPEIDPQHMSQKTLIYLEKQL